MEGSVSRAGKLGILVGGGPAPGINGVIGAATIEAIHHGFEVVGILDGFKWLAVGDATHTRPLRERDVDVARFRGGSILFTSRENPTESETKLANVVQALQTLGVRHLVTIGGDDTAYSAHRVSQEAKGAIHVAHVPKTIDNDLPLPLNMPTFGFRTAYDVGGRLVSHLVEDARTTHRWYVVVGMGRRTGHLALGMGYAGGAVLTLIPEEFSPGTVTLDLICRIIEGAILKARCQRRDHGVVVVAEGVAERIVEEIKTFPYVKVKLDESKNIRLSEVPFALILKNVLQDRAATRGEEAALVDTTIGYELRCADPIPYDIEYTQQLGWGAVRYLLRLGEESWDQPGAMISIQMGEVVPIPLGSIIDPTTKRMAVRWVNVGSDHYRSARSYMIRLEREDLEQVGRLAPLAAAAKLPEEQFRQRFGPVVGLP